MFCPLEKGQVVASLLPFNNRQKPAISFIKNDHQQKYERNQRQPGRDRYLPPPPTSYVIPSPLIIIISIVVFVVFVSRNIIINHHSDDMTVCQFDSASTPTVC